MNHRRLFALCLLIALGVSSWFLFSRLSFTPVPWPDGSAFYLPSIDLLSWPPSWRMHSQAAFVPSYDVANFNMLPVLPLLLGISEKLGLFSILPPALAIKAVSLVALMLWFATLITWASSILPQTKRRYLLLIALGSAAVFDPVIRWGTLVVRSEAWIALYWILILTQLTHLSTKPKGSPEHRRLWIISGLLALAAYTHFEAIILVPATVVGLLPIAGTPRDIAKRWIRRLFTVGTRTALFLLPWAVYVAIHFRLFLSQMETQFHRLMNGNVWISDSYRIFHSLFIALGSPVAWPKVFNVAKVAFWALLALLFARTILLTFSKYRTADDSRPNAHLTIPLLASATACVASFYLWFTKPEVWFTTLCHQMFWPWAAVTAAATWEESSTKKRRATFIFILVGLYGIISLVATVQQQHQIPKTYSWANYERWIDCIESKVPATGSAKVWQPHTPDILVDLSHRRPEWDLTRTLDFQVSDAVIWKLLDRSDALILSRHFPVSVKSDGSTPQYSGPLREEDRALMRDNIEVPFGPWALDRLPIERPGRWSYATCQIGPFWSVIAAQIRW